ISNSVATVNNNTLIIIYQKNKRTLHTGTPAYTFGRDAQCDQVVDSSLVSRVHAKIENRRGKFLLIDESTNGSYIKNGSNHSLFLRREEVILNGEGVISFGEEIDSNSQFLLQFNLPG
ncbi:MAG: FHA domain-containing protein, partial [Proteobacteria bacterium]|nr:FHA domain-containing protein [Pseudomonadota bacterium]